MTLSFVYIYECVNWTLLSIIFLNALFNIEKSFQRIAVYIKILLSFYNSFISQVPKKLL